MNANGQFPLNATVSTNSPADPKDTYRTKSALHRLGHYEVPEWGLTEITDDAMYAGVRSFQIQHDLASDGVMTPGGPTARKLGVELNRLPPPPPLGFRDNSALGPLGLARTRQAEAGRLSDDHLEGSEGSDTLVGGSGSDTLGGGTGADLEKRYAPTLARDRGVVNFLADHDDKPDTTFREAARAAGLDPDRAAFIRDALRADNNEHDRLVERGYDLYGSLVGGQLHATLKKIGWTNDPDTRRHLMAPYLKYARPRPDGEKAGRIVTEAIVCGAALGARSAGRKPSTSINPASRAKQRLTNAASYLRGRFERG